MNRLYPALSLIVLFMVTGCASRPSFQHAFASGHYAPDIAQCVPYAREASGIRLSGDADGWWGQAAGHYRRGNIPEPGAVLVLKKTPRMRSGHVAVVKDIINAREIDVTHSNWGNDRSSRHIIYDSMRAEDVSAAGDWSKVRFWNDGKGVMGLPYEAYGFIYP